MILLPPNPQRAWLRSFWAAGCLVGAMLVGTLACLYGAKWLSLAAVIVILFTAGTIAPHWLVRPYRAWNKLARLYARYAERLVLRIAFTTVCVPAGWAAPRIQVRRPASEGSLWLARQKQTSIDQARGKNDKPTETWVARYLAWARQSREIWRLALLPFLIVLAALHSTEQESTVPENIYTLF
jgi:hypothetical protein